MMPSVSANPVLVEVVRGAMVESRHRGAAAVVDAGGRVRAAWGDVDRPVFPRSAIKQLQALSLIETGAADAFSVTDAEIALACASHNGEPAHVEGVARWLERLGLGPADLACAAHAPLGQLAADAMARKGEAATALHNNCSGKHAAMLATARHLAEPIDEYLSPDHPVQRRIQALLAEMGDRDLGAGPVAVDGCGVPTWAMPLKSIARAMARMADPGGLPPARKAAALRVRAAMAAHPFMVAGTDRFCTDVIALKGETVLVKGGAEGMYTAILPGPALGVALKIDDGAKRAAEVAAAAILRYLGALDAADWAALSGHVAPPVLNHAGRVVGEIRAAPGWPNRPDRRD